MSKTTTNSPVDHTSDAGYRTWVAEIITQLLAVGLTQTSDTGQINTSTVTRPAVNTDGGYAVFRFNDATQTGAPFFLKLFFGTAATATIPRIRAQTGTASNGAGTLSGLGSANTDTVTTVAATSSSTLSYPSYFCYVGNCLWFAWKVGSFGTVNYGHGCGVWFRSTDATQASTTDAVVQMISAGTSNWTARTMSYLSNTIYTNSGAGSFTLVHYGVSTSLVGSTPQTYKAYYITPQVQPALFISAAFQSEFASGSTFVETPIGSTARTFICVQGFQTTSFWAAMIWE